MIFDRFVIDNYLKYTLPYLEYFRVREGYCVISTKKIDITPGYSKLHEFDRACNFRQFKLRVGYFEIFFSNNGYFEIIFAWGTY